MELGDVDQQRALWNALQQSQIGAAASRFGASTAANASMNNARLANQLGNRGLNLQGIQDLFGMGQTEQQAGQTELSGQYQDFLRQSGALRDQFQYPDYLSLQTLARGYPTQTPIQYGQSNSQQLIDLLSGLGGSGSNDWITQLLGSLGSGTQGGTGQTDGVQYDGTHYDSTPAQSQQAQYQQWLAAMGQGTTGTGGGATNYQDRLTQEILASQKAQQGVKPSTAQKGMDVIAMLAALLGVGKGKGGGLGGGGGRGGGALSNIADAVKGLFPSSPNYINNTPNTPGTSYGQPIGPGLPGSPGGIPGLTDNTGGSFGSYLDNQQSVPQDFGISNADNPPNIDLGGDLNVGGGDTWGYGDFGGGFGDGGGGGDFGAV
jgi:hypothetical protein